MRDIKVTLNERELLILVNALKGSLNKPQSRLRQRLEDVLDFVEGARKEIDRMS